MSRFRVLIALPLVASLFAPLGAQAASQSLVISEVQTGSATNASQEFVELYNPTGTDVAVDGWLLQYKSATSAAVESSWTKRAALVGTVKTHGFYLIAQKSYLSGADADLSTAGLSGTGGHVRLKDAGGNVIDLVGWGSTANASETAPAAAPAAGQSIERLPGRLIEDGGNATDTDDNSKDFIIRAVSQPQLSAAPIEEPAANAPVTSNDAPADDQPAPTPVTYQALLITEVLPNPAAPLTDAHDEFIELFNPNSSAVNLKGYTLRAGSNFHSFYNLPDKTIAPGAYVVVYASESHIGISNSGGAVQLLDPAGAVLSQTDDYSKAATGQSWSLIDGVWKWSLQTTPGADNVYVAPLLDNLLTTTTGVPKTKASSGSSNPSSKTALTTPKSSTKTTKTAAPKTTKAKTSSQTPLVAAASTHSAAWLLIGLAVLSIGYALYEFRHDIRNYYHVARRYLKARRTNRPAA